MKLNSSDKLAIYNFIYFLFFPIFTFAINYVNVYLVGNFLLYNLIFRLIRFLVMFCRPGLKGTRVKISDGQATVNGEYAFIMPLKLKLWEGESNAFVSMSQDTAS